MTSRKTISSLSIAAIALLAAAVPSFAQAQSDRDAVATQASEQSIVSSTELSAVVKARVATTATADGERTPVNKVTRTASQPVWSASAFKVHNNFTSGTSSHFVRSQQTFNAGPIDPTAKKQFRADDDDYSSTGIKLVTFVPSRGQKLPE